MNGKGCHVEVRQHRLSSEVYEIAIASLSGSAAQDSLSVTVEEIPIQRLVSDVLSHARKVSG